MPLGEMGVLLLVLVAICIFGNLWFHLIEAILKWIKKQLTRHREPPAWHTLPSDEEDRGNG